MNILLFAPGLLLLLVQANGFVGTAVCLSICAGVQVRTIVVDDVARGYLYRVAFVYSPLSLFRLFL